MNVFYRKQHSKYVKEAELSKIIDEFSLNWSYDELKKMLIETKGVGQPIVKVWCKNGKYITMTITKEQIMFI